MNSEIESETLSDTDNFCLIDDDLLAVADETEHAYQQNTPRSNPPSKGVGNDTSVDAHNSSTPSDICRYCGGFSNLNMALRSVGHTVCYRCMEERRASHNYTCISQTRALEKYSLTLQDVRQNASTLAVKHIPNPRGYGNPMKLYYEFQLMELATRKYGSLDAVMQALDKREEDRLSRVLRDDVLKRHAGSSNSKKLSRKPKQAAKKRMNTSSPPGHSTDGRSSKAHKPDPCRVHTFGNTQIADALDAAQHTGINKAENWTKSPLYRRECTVCGEIEEWEELVA